MTGHRRADVWLPADVARCEPSGSCDRRWTCGRYLAEIPRHGGSVADFTIARAAGVECTEWRAVERPPASAPERRVFPPLSSLGDISPTSAL